MLIDILDDLLYTVFKPNFECFRKVRYFAKFFMEKDARWRPFFGIPCAADWPTNDSSGGASRLRYCHIEKNHGKVSC